MKLNKLKTYNLTELNKEYKEKALKLKQYELDCKSGKEKDSSKIKLYRRDVARILTLLNQKSQLEEVEAIIEDIKASKKKEEVVKSEPEVKVEKVVKTKKELKVEKKEKTTKKSKKETIKK